MYGCELRGISVRWMHDTYCSGSNTTDVRSLSNFELFNDTVIFFITLRQIPCKVVQCFICPVLNVGVAFRRNSEFVLLLGLYRVTLFLLGKNVLRCEV